MAVRAYTWYPYISDNGITYAIKIDTNTAAQGGFAGAIAPPPANPAWPWSYRDLRHVTGKSIGGTHARMIIGQSTNTKYVSGGTFADGNGTLYSIEGALGERRPGNHLR